MIRSIIIIVLFVFIHVCNIVATSSSYKVFSFNSPKYETRAVWLTTIGGLDWPHSYAQSRASIERQQRELMSILDKLKAANINTVLFQTRVRGTVLYTSKYEDWDGCLSGFPGRSPGYDALQFAIDECHKRGMEIQAWLVCIPIGNWVSYGCKELRRKHPDLVKRIGDEGVLNPERKETATYLSNLCAEITERYDIDGIHLDYIRYHEKDETKGGKGERVLENIRRRDNITRIVRNVHNKVKSLKPWVKLSCSPIGKYDDLSRYSSFGWNAYNKGAQDVSSWLSEGLMDEVYPMMYFQGEHFYPFALDWNERKQDKNISSGLGIYFLSEKEKNWSLDVITREMNFVRSLGLGQAYFRSKFFTDDIKGIYSYVCNSFYFYPAFNPPMNAHRKLLPKKPINLELLRVDSMLVLKWDRVETDRDEPSFLYNVYCSRTYPVDTSKASNILAMRLRTNQLVIPQSMRHWYFKVVYMDRYGRECE